MRRGEESRDGLNCYIRRGGGGEGPPGRRGCCAAAAAGRPAAAPGKDEFRGERSATQQKLEGTVINELSLLQAFVLFYFIIFLFVFTQQRIAPASNIL